MNNFTQRTITGFSFVGVVIASIVIHPLTFAVLFLLISLLSLHEFYKLASKEGVRPLEIPAYIAAVIIYCTPWVLVYYPENTKFMYLDVIVLFLPFIFQLYRKAEKPFTNIAFTLLGIVYVMLPFSLLASFYFINFPLYGVQFGVLFGFFGLIWINDTGAYLVGSLIGKHRLFERISPKKSWEGSIGGAIFTLGGAVLCYYLFADLYVWQWLVVALIVSIIGTLGDLTESLFKRSIGVKDSGAILPGHGGMLDRFDNVFLSAPFVFVFLMLIS